PTAIVLKNEIGNIIWAYQETGVYTGTLLNAFPQYKTTYFGNYTDVVNSIFQINIVPSAPNGFVITSVISGGENLGQPINGILGYLPFTIRVYK
ncbi:MAG TPA: hypothetical protein PKN44_10165, partial [Bacteroidales bacterium]|nr:hypothetical protein [Bacteroidales bacterium]